MRIRSTKPEFWRSRTIASLDWDARLVLKGIESYVDDNGVGKDSVVLIAADVFPHDLASDSGTLARISGALARLSEADLLVRYVFDGEPLIYVRRWKDVQRVDKPNKGRYPRPDGTREYEQDVDETIGPGQSPAGPPEPPPVRDASANPRETLANPPEGLAPGTGEQGNRGTGDSTAPRKRGRRIPDDFAVTDDMRQWAADNGFAHLDLDRITTEFRDYWAAEAGQRAVKLDWVKTWRNRIRAVADRTPANVRALRPPGPDGHLPPETVAEVLGQDRWTCPPAPAGMDPDEAWEWQRRLQVEHLHAREAEARTRLGVRA